MAGIGHADVFGASASTQSAAGTLAGVGAAAGFPPGAADAVLVQGAGVAVGTGAAKQGSVASAVAAAIANLVGASSGGGGGVGALSTTLSLNSTAGGASVPFTIGQPFVIGDVPTGNYVVAAGAASAQVNVVNRWPDGSARFAIISGHAALTANVLATLSLTDTTTPPGGVNIPEQWLINFAPSVTMQCGAIGTVSLASLLGTTPIGVDGTGLVRSFPGPVMSEFHYRGKVGANAHLRVYFVCRVYSANATSATAVEIETIVENGFTNVAAPQMWQYVPTLTVNGVAIWTNGGATFSHFHHTRIPWISWHGTGAGVNPNYGVIPSHNLAYCKASRVVPNYGTTTTSTAYLNGLTVAFTPYAKGDYQAAWGVTGRQDQIGLLPNWEAAYWTDAASQAWQASIANAQIGMGFYHHYRDETTGRPVKARSYAATSWGANPGFTNGSANQGGTTSLPANDANFPTYPQTYGWNEQHHPQMAVTAYLTTGRWSFMEELQFLAGAMGIDGSAVYGWHASNGSPVFDTVTSNSTRGCAWMLRDHVWALSLSMDDAVLQASDQGFAAEYQRIFNDNTAWYATNYNPAGVPANPLGVFKCYDNGDWGGVGPNNYLAGNVTGMCMFEQDFFTASVGLAWDQQVALGTTGAANLALMMNFAALSYDGRVGLQTGGAACFTQGLGVFCWEVSPNNPSGKTIAQFNADLASTANWYNAFVNTVGNSGYNGGLSLGTCTIGSPLVGNSGAAPGAQQSFWDNALPGLSMLADYGDANCILGYSYLTSASNWTTLTSALADNPVWYVSPRTNPGLPYALPASGQALAMPGTTLDSIRPSVVSASNWEYSLCESWSGGTFVSDYSTYGAYVIVGSGGHGVQCNLGAAGIDFTTGNAFRVDNANGLTYAETNAILGTGTNDDFHWSVDVLQPYGELQNSAGRFTTITGHMPATCHTYLQTMTLPHLYGGGAKGSVMQTMNVAIGYDPGQSSPDISLSWSHAFDLSTGLWTRYASNAVTASAGWYSGAPLEDAPAAFDSTTGTYYQLSSEPWASSDLAGMTTTSQAWSGIAMGGAWPGSAGANGTAFVDPKRRLLVAAFNTASQVWGALDLTNTASAPVQLSVTGMPTGLPWTRWHYYPPGDCFYTHIGTDTNKIYKLTPPSGNALTGTWVVTTETIGGAAMATQGNTFGNGASHYNRFFYVPAIQCFAWIASTTSAVVLIKP